MKRPQHNNTIRRASLTLLALIMTCAAAWAQNSVTYIAADGTTQTANNVTEINTTNMPTTLSGWYVVSGNVSYTEAVTLSDNTTIILADGAAMNRTIEGYGDNNDGWVFIASPVSGSIEPDAVGNIFSATEYDLYRFNQSAANPSLTNVESDDLRGTKQSSGDGPSTGSGALTLDNAIVSFNEGAKLGKFYFGHQDANIYILRLINGDSIRTQKIVVK